MIKIMAFPVSLHDICTLGIIDEPDIESSIRRDVFNVEPFDVLLANCTGRETTEFIQIKTGTSYSGAFFKNPSSCRVHEHGISEPGDEIWLDSHFPKRSNQIGSSGIQKRPDPTAHEQQAALEEC